MAQGVHPVYPAFRFVANPPLFETFWVISPLAGVLRLAQFFLFFFFLHTFGSTRPSLGKNVLLPLAFSFLMLPPSLSMFITACFLRTNCFFFPLSALATFLKVCGRFSLRSFFFRE